MKKASPKAIHIGVISDTHGLLRPEALRVLAESDHIIHAGDVGTPEILEKLAQISPVTAVRGNVDTEPWARKLPLEDVVGIGGVSIYVLHDLAKIDLKPQAAGFQAVISGHTHMARNETSDGVLYFNPGSAGPRRFKLPVSVGWLTLAKGQVRAEVIVLDV